MSSVASRSGDGRMGDKEKTVAELKEKVAAFVSERDWAQFHSPKNLSMSITIEAAELMELFQWATLEESRAICSDPVKAEKVREEIADIVIYCLSLCNILGIDLAEAVESKVDKNASKYPRDKYRGSYERKDSLPE